MDKFYFMRIYPGSNTLEQLAYDISVYFQENPLVIGVEVFVDSEDSTPKAIGFVRNPAMKPIFEDAYAIYNKHKRDSQERTVDVRLKS